MLKADFFVSLWPQFYLAETMRCVNNALLFRGNSGGPVSKPVKSAVTERGNHFLIVAADLPIRKTSTLIYLIISDTITCQMSHSEKKGREIWNIYKVDIFCCFKIDWCNVNHSQTPVAAV